MQLDFVQRAGCVVKPEHWADTLDGILKVLQFQELRKVLDHFSVLVRDPQLHFQKVQSPRGHGLLCLSLSDGEVQMVAERVQESLGAELGEDGLDVHIVGASPLDLRAVVSQPGDQRSSVLRAAEGLVVGVQDTDIPAVSAERVDHVCACGRRCPGKERHKQTGENWVENTTTKQTNPGSWCSRMKRA